MSKFRIIIAGCGNMSKAWIDCAVSREDAEIAALVDVDIEAAIDKARQFKLSCPCYTSVEEAIKASGANLVFDVTVPESHINVVSTALRMGCDVFGEKPMAATIEDARQLVKESERYNKSYSVMQNRRYMANIRALQQLISQGCIGETGFVCADFFLGPHFGGFRDIMDSPLILDMAIHTFDQARFITGADPVSVYCHEFNPPGSWYRGSAAAACIFEMSNGAVFCYRGSWCAEGCSTSWEASWRISGSKGTALWDGDGMPYYECVIPSPTPKWMNETQKVEFDWLWNGRTGHDGCFDEMFEALIQKRKAETDCTDNIKSMEMVFGAIRSAREGRRISLM